MKVYCAVHDYGYNEYRKNAIERFKQGKITCKCCGKYMDPIINNAFNFDVDNKECNCFITYFNGQYSSEEIEKFKYYRYTDEMEREVNEELKI